MEFSKTPLHKKYNINEGGFTGNQIHSKLQQMSLLQMAPIFAWFETPADILDIPRQR